MNLKQDAEMCKSKAEYILLEKQDKRQALYFSLTNRVPS